MNKNVMPVLFCSMLLVTMFSVGCQHTVNPWVDDLPVSSEITTASVEGARFATSHPTLTARGFEPTAIEAQRGAVAHWPLWFEDPFEDKGSDDGQFALTWVDYFAYGYGGGRNIANMLFWPVSAAMTPPFTVMCSDGQLSKQGLGYDHDAVRCPGGTSPPIDILEVGTLYEEPVESGTTS